MKRNNLPAILLAALLFGSGAIVGALAHRYYSPSIVVANSPERFRQNDVSEMQSKLALTPAQVSSLHAILDDTRTKVHAVHEQSRPEMMKIKAEQVSRIKAMLTRGQLPLYEKLMADRERRNREREDHDRQNDLKHHTIP